MSKIIVDHLIRKARGRWWKEGGEGRERERMKGNDSGINSEKTESNTEQKEIEGEDGEEDMETN